VGANALLDVKGTCSVFDRGCIACTHAGPDIITYPFDRGAARMYAVCSVPKTPMVMRISIWCAFAIHTPCLFLKVYAAKQRGIRLLLTIGNLWAAYKGPEEFLLQATGSAGVAPAIGGWGCIVLPTATHSTCFTLLPPA
jgi:hypothetical protein